MNTLIEIQPSDMIMGQKYLHYANNLIKRWAGPNLITALRIDTYNPNYSCVHTDSSIELRDLAINNINKFYVVPNGPYPPAEEFVAQAAWNALWQDLHNAIEERYPIHNPLNVYAAPYIDPISTHEIDPITHEVFRTGDLCVRLCKNNQYIYHIHTLHDWFKYRNVNPMTNTIVYQADIEQFIYI